MALIIKSGSMNNKCYCTILKRKVSGFECHWSRHISFIDQLWYISEVYNFEAILKSPAESRGLEAQIFRFLFPGTNYSKRIPLEKNHSLLASVIIR